MFIPAFREGGGPIAAKSYYIATATAIEKGTMVKFTPGTGIEQSAGTDFDDPAIGVAAEAHAANSGYSIMVYTDPDIVYSTVPKQLSTTTSGTDATSWIDSSLTAANDIFNGGHIVVVSGTGMTAGIVYNITDFANSGGDVTVDGNGVTIPASATGYIYPGKLAVGSFAFDTNSTFDNIDLDTAGGESLVIVDVEWDATKKEAIVYCKLRLHQFGNHVLAL